MRMDTFTGPACETAARIVRRFTAAPFLVRALVLGVVTMAISGIAHAVAQPARENADATRLLDSIVAGEADLELVPNEFTSDMGYTPVSTSGALRNPNGGCSTPGALGPEEFAAACQTHDLGYDLLRYAEIEGTRLDANARFDLDWKLYVDLMETCDTAACSLTATAYYGAVSANSIRQGYKTPHAEPATPWMALVFGVLGISAVSGPAMREYLGRR